MCARWRRLVSDKQFIMQLHLRLYTPRELFICSEYCLSVSYVGKIFNKTKMFNNSLSPVDKKWQPKCWLFLMYYLIWPLFIYNVWRCNCPCTQLEDVHWVGLYTARPFYCFYMVVGFQFQTTASLSPMPVE